MTPRLTRKQLILLPVSETCQQWAFFSLLTTSPLALPSSLSSSTSSTSSSPSSPSSPGANSDGPRSRLAKISSHAGEDLEHHPMIHRHGWFWWSSCSWCSLWWWSFWDSGELRIGIEEPHEGDACMHICILYISFSMERRQAYFDQPFCPQIPSLIGFCSIILPPQ